MHIFRIFLVNLHWTVILHKFLKILLKYIPKNITKIVQLLHFFTCNFIKKTSKFNKTDSIFEIWLRIKKPKNSPQNLEPLVHCTYKNNFKIKLFPTVIMFPLKLFTLFPSRNQSVKKLVRVQLDAKTLSWNCSIPAAMTVCVHLLIGKK